MNVAGEGLRLVWRLAGAVVAVPVIVGFVLLGAAVLIGRSLRDAAGETRRRLSSLGPRPREQETRHRAA